MGATIERDRKIRSGLGLVAGLCALALAAGSGISPAGAQSGSAVDRMPVQMAKPTARAKEPSPPAAAKQASPPAASRQPIRSANVAAPAGHSPIKEPVTAAACKAEPGKPYFVEFRARTAASYGHSFVLFGRLAGPGKFGPLEVAGLHPKSENPAVYVTGMMMPVPSETGLSDGDLDEQYLIARYCVVLNEAEYNKVVAYIRKLQATSPIWHATTINCNGFIRDIARSMGLKAPTSHMLYPEVYVNQMREMNGGRGAAFSTSLIPYEQWGIQRSR